MAAGGGSIDAKSEEVIPADDTRARNEKDAAVDGQQYSNKGWRYWAIITALSVTALIPAMEGTVVSTALPTIVQELRGAEYYVWVVNSYFLTRLGF